MLWPIFLGGGGGSGGRILQGADVSRTYRFGDFFLASFFGLVGRTTAAIQARQIVLIRQQLEDKQSPTQTFD